MIMLLVTRTVLVLVMTIHTSLFFKLGEDNQAEETHLDDNDMTVDNDEEVINEVVDSENTSRPVDRSDEEWVRDAVLDVAYYLRAHKFNDFDRRYNTEATEESHQYKTFPNPPLRYLHWEVYRNCDKGFYECLAYLQDTVLKAELVRSLDTNVVMNERRWEFPRNSKSIEKLDKECQRLKAIDWRDADPFKGPLERFQWRVSASYYMCYFSMQNFSPLMMFGERCDNFAGCLLGKTPSNFDPRGDDAEPYQCAIYSFCPEVCCPQKRVIDIEECLDLRENPCFWQKERSKRTCELRREDNRDLNAIAMNQWNVTCQCDSGFEWLSMFGSCVDIDECSMGTHDCAAVIQDCVNLKGHYGCVCAWGYVNVSGNCVHNDLLTRAMDSLHQHYHPPPTPPPRPFSFFQFLFNWTIGVFHQKEVATSDTELSMFKANESDNLIDLDLDLEES